MQTAQARHTLLTMIADRGLTLDDIDAPAAIDLMLQFYSEHRAGDVVDFDEDGDMVLYEWGVFDFGGGPSFQFGLTRQFVLSGEVGDDAIRQLVLMLHYEASTQASELGRGHKWCHRPEELDSLRTFIEMSSAAAFVSDRLPTQVVLRYEYV